MLAMQSVCGLALVWGSRDGLPGATLVVVAAEACDVVDPRVTRGWVIAQTLLLIGVFWHMGGPVTAVAAGGAYGGFQIFAVATMSLARSESRAREDLAWTNAELTATRELLAENSRVAERLRISRDLHDTLGHHLTALSLQLEVASRLSGGPAAERVEEAHAITRLLLSDVRDVVSRLRGSSRVDLTQAVRVLATAGGPLKIHIDMPTRLDLDDPAQAHALLRCVQEVITNASRHADAQNLWIEIEQRPEGVDLRARDDGRGVARLTCGNGLRGMRERFEEYAGTVEFRSATGEGFEVHGFMPRPEVIA
jgi:signal transduction histidine kinase